MKQELLTELADLELDLERNRNLSNYAKFLLEQRLEQLDKLIEIEENN